MGVLERKRLEFVNQEKNLTPAVKSLLASVVTVELQMSRAPQGNGLTVIAFLTDHQGKPIAKLTVQSKEASIPELVGPLLEQIHKTLAVAAPAVGGDPIREGERFAREAEHLLSHKHYLQALQAAEAAFALAPAKPHHSALLSECLIIMGTHVANPKGMNAMYGGRIRKVNRRMKTSLRWPAALRDPHAGAAHLQPRTLVSVTNDNALHTPQHTRNALAVIN